VTNKPGCVRDPLLRSRMPELDSLRGVAVLLVLFFHGFGFTYGVERLSGIPKILVAATLPGWAGVNLFFVLSGFLISGILLDTRQKPDYYKHFYLRRALRILPIYYAVLFLLAMLSRMGLIARHASWSFLGLSALYLANMTELFGVSMQYGVLWTLAIEEHFYMFWPAFVRSLSRRGVMICAIAICIFCPALRAIYCLFHYDVGKGYTWLYADGLALGAVLAAVIRSPLGSRRGMWLVSGSLLTASALIFGVGAPFGIFLASRRLGLILRPTALNVLFAGTVTVVLLIGSSRQKLFVNRPILQFFGYISYGVYLLHMLVFDLVDHFFPRLAPASLTAGDFPTMVLRFCIGAGTTIGIAYVSRKYFEDWFLKRKDEFEHDNSLSVVSPFETREKMAVVSPVADTNSQLVSKGYRVKKDGKSLSESAEVGT